jgi:hypothetical protein
MLRGMLDEADSPWIPSDNVSPPEELQPYVSPLITECESILPQRGIFEAKTGALITICTLRWFLELVTGWSYKFKDKKNVKLRPEILSVIADKAGVTPDVVKDFCLYLWAIYRNDPSTLDLYIRSIDMLYDTSNERFENWSAQRDTFKYYSLRNRLDPNTSRIKLQVPVHLESTILPPEIIHIFVSADTDVNPISRSLPPLRMMRFPKMQFPGGPVASLDVTRFVNRVSKTSKLSGPLTDHSKYSNSDDLFYVGHPVTNRLVDPLSSSQWLCNFDNATREIEYSIGLTRIRDFDGHTRLYAVEPVNTDGDYIALILRYAGRPFPRPIALFHVPVDVFSVNNLRMFGRLVGLPFNYHDINFPLRDVFSNIEDYISTEASLLLASLQHVLVTFNRKVLKTQNSLNAGDDKLVVVSDNFIIPTGAYLQRQWCPRSLDTQLGMLLTLQQQLTIVYLRLAKHGGFSITPLSKTTVNVKDVKANFSDGDGIIGRAPCVRLSLIIWLLQIRLSIFLYYTHIHFDGYRTLPSIAPGFPITLAGTSGVISDLVPPTEEWSASALLSTLSRVDILKWYLYGATYGTFAHVGQ